MLQLNPDSAFESSLAAGYTMSDERRTHKRYEVEGVSGSFLFTTNATVLNLSLDGMSLETFNPLKIGRKYSLKLEEGEGHLPVEGTVVWCTLVKTTRDSHGQVRPVYRAGVHFEDVLSGKACELRTLIHKNAVVSLENRLFGRFRIDTEQAADLILEAEFTVEELSLSGMLVRTDVAPPVDAHCHIDIQLGQIRFDALARVARVERAGEDPAEREEDTLLGIQFKKLKGESRKTLESFIANDLT